MDLLSKKLSLSKIRQTRHRIFKLTLLWIGCHWKPTRKFGKARVLCNKTEIDRYWIWSKVSPRQRRFSCSIIIDNKRHNDFTKIWLIYSSSFLSIAWAFMRKTFRKCLNRKETSRSSTKCNFSLVKNICAVAACSVPIEFLLTLMKACTMLAGRYQLF